MSEVLDLAVVITAVGGASLWALRRLTRAGSSRTQPSGCRSCAASTRRPAPQPPRDGSRQPALPHFGGASRRPPYLRSVPAPEAGAGPEKAPLRTEDPPVRP